MKNLRTRIAVLVISFVSFLGIQTANAVEPGFSVGLAYNSAVFVGTGKETSTSGATTTKRNVDHEETGIFQDSVSSAFVEANLGMVSIGVEYHLEDIQTPENTNKQGSVGVAGTLKTNTVKATFEDHTTIYANLNFTPNAYLKVGYLMADVATQENLGTGGAYPNVDTTGYTVGLGYQHTVDNGFFARIELTASDYDDVTAKNSNETDKEVSVNDMYGAAASLKIGKAF